MLSEKEFRGRNSGDTILISPASVCNQARIGPTVVVRKEDGQSPITALRHMMWRAGNDDTGKSGHVLRLSRDKAVWLISIVSPEPPVTDDKSTLTYSCGWPPRWIVDNHTVKDRQSRIKPLTERRPQHHRNCRNYNAALERRNFRDTR